MELFNVDFGLVFWMFVAFAILFVILWRWGWPAVMKGVNNRADLINKGVEYARDAKQQLDNANNRAAEIIAEAQRHQAERLREADKMKTQIIEEAREAAKNEARKEMDAAKVSIEQERKKAEQDLRNQASSLALEIAGKVVKTQLQDPAAQKKLVDAVITDMEKNNG